MLPPKTSSMSGVWASTYGHEGLWGLCFHQGHSDLNGPCWHSWPWCHSGQGCWLGSCWGPFPCIWQGLVNVCCSWFHWGQSRWLGTGQTPQRTLGPEDHAAARALLISVYGSAIWCHKYVCHSLLPRIMSGFPFLQQLGIMMIDTHDPY